MTEKNHIIASDRGTVTEPLTEEEQEQRKYVGCFAVILLMLADIAISVALGIMYGPQWGLVSVSMCPRAGRP